MSKVIKFRNPKAVEDRFFDTLNKSQLEMFYEIISKAAVEYEELKAKYESKIAECETLKMDNELLKGLVNGKMV